MTTVIATGEPAVVPQGAEVLPGYRVEQLLARGGRTDTYDVTSLTRDCRAVVKVVRPDRRHEPRVAEAVLSEGVLLTTLAHPHLVRGYEVVREPVPAIVMEAVPGATLAALVDDRRLGVADAIVLGRQLVSVLGYLHHHGWLHLDVKPDNVVVQEGRAVLIDLGVAARPGAQRRAVGTVGFAAPEQDVGGVLSGAADVRGWGATVFAAVTGRAPDADPDLRGVPRELRDLLGACLSADPRRRPSLDALRVSLDLLAQGSCSARPRWRRSWR